SLGALRPAVAAEPTPTAPSPYPPAAGEVETLPIDLPTALRVVNAANPTIALARERVNEAYARLRQAEVFWLPNLQAIAPSYQRHDGPIQATTGEVIPVSRSSLFV